MRSLILKIMVFCLLVATPVNAQEKFSLREQDVVNSLKNEMVEQGLDDNVEFEFFGGQTSFDIPQAKVVKVMISNLKFNELQNKFSSGMEIFADGNSYAKTSLNGKFYTLGNVYVPAKNIGKGERISEDMLKEVSVRINRVKPQNVVDKEKLVNKQAKKTLAEGKLINDRDVGRLVLIKKGDVVTSVYRSKSMQITAKAEAKEDGAQGDKIEIINTKSKKSVYGIVLDVNTVEVQAH